MKFLVTGGAGFIGSHLVRNLVDNGDSVVVLDDLSSGKKENLSPVLSKIRFVQGSVVRKEDVARAMEGVDFVLHEAAQVSVAKSMLDLDRNNEINVTGMLNVLESARSAKVKRLVFASSCAIYGDRPDLPHRETMNPTPKSPYALTKLIGEQYCRMFSEEFGLSTVSLRYFNVFGERQDPKAEYAAVIPKFITSALSGKPPTIFGDGEQTRDFVHVDNVVRANLLACGIPQGKGEIYNIGAGRSYSLKDLLREVSEITRVEMNPVYSDPRPGDVKHTLADISAAEKGLGFRVDVDFRKGLERTVKFFQTR